MSYEFKNCDKIKKGHFGWRSDISLEDMIKPENIKKIKEQYANKKISKKAEIKRLISIF